MYKKIETWQGAVDQHIDHKDRPCISCGKGAYIVETIYDKSQGLVECDHCGAKYPRWTWRPNFQSI